MWSVRNGGPRRKLQTETAPKFSGLLHNSRCIETSICYASVEAIMDTNKKKRKQGASEAPLKRRKTQQPQQIKSKRPVAVDKLRWKTVEVPEMFDDAEGFYGLEEVEGVEVVRQGDTVSFVSAEVTGECLDSANRTSGYCHRCHDRRQRRWRGLRRIRRRTGDS